MTTSMMWTKLTTTDRDEHDAFTTAAVSTQMHGSYRNYTNYTITVEANGLNSTQI
eukprot:CAMPEP_0202717620 /NCGR_PEP_ID=MMETSP1385-20130828/113326_1 /ASSEMBLY_ACC=CAM_ASM_000861 /TAXON_ID=933848 /ORGANISM="Elphidium margaritaceum" /LENGTH=54 /DNA_ID=CAMNT_0049379927 /DNA_START=18 /DNA_END=179 /DNA_ORIENTATION=-